MVFDGNYFTKILQIIEFFYLLFPLVLCHIVCQLSAFVLVGPAWGSA